MPELFYYKEVAPMRLVDKGCICLSLEQVAWCSKHGLRESWKKRTISGHYLLSLVSQRARKPHGIKQILIWPGVVCNESPFARSKNIKWPWVVCNESLIPRSKKLKSIITCDMWLRTVKTLTINNHICIHLHLVAPDVYKAI